MSENEELQLTLDDCVQEVLGILTGLDLNYDPDQDRYRAITRSLNRAMRSMALEREWSWYSDTVSIGTVVPGENKVWLPNSLRPRIINDDAIRLVHEDGHVLRWAYFLPRDAGHKYQERAGLWATVTRNEITFTRPFQLQEDGLDIQLPVMREPYQFRLPPIPADPEDPLVPVPQEIRDQLLDFQYPDVCVLRAAFYYAQTDPVMQPRVQSLEAQYKDIMYQVIEREDRNTDSPYLNDFFVPVQSDIHGIDYRSHMHPHADERRI
jgi:hypothetical protein